jgi:SAM-dependent methyltransferase
MNQDISSRGEGALPLTGERTGPGIRQENYWFRRHEAAYRFATGVTAGRVLDAGCGEGYGAASLGADVALELDAGAAAHATAAYPALRVVRADLCHPPVRPGSIDTLVAMQVLEHLWCPDRFVERAREILTTGGRLVLSTPNRLTFSPDGARNPFHAHEYTAQELEAVLRRAFDRVEVRGVRPGVFLRSLDVLAAGSLQQLLMETPYDDLPPKLRIGVGLVRARHFALGAAEGSLDLFAVAS